MLGTYAGGSGHADLRSPSHPGLAPATVVGVGLPTPEHLPGSSRPKWHQRLWKRVEEAAGWPSPRVPARAGSPPPTPVSFLRFCRGLIPSLGVEPQCGREPFSSESALGTTRCRRSRSRATTGHRTTGSAENWTPEIGGDRANHPGSGRHRGSP